MIFHQEERAVSSSAVARGSVSAATPVAAPSRPPARWLALGAVLGPLLFTLAWIVFGVLQPATPTAFGVMGGLSGAISNPISGLGVGPSAAPFNTAFVACGLLQLIGTVGAIQAIRPGGRIALRTLCVVLLAISPLCLALAGIFTLASALLVHVVVGTLLFASPVLGFLVTGAFLRGTPGWKQLGTALLVASPLTLLLFILYLASFDQATASAGLGIAGLTERVLMVQVQAWYVALGWLAFRRS
jgi:hypothetical membrane protein